VKPVTALCVAALVLPLVHPDKNLRLAFAVGLAVAVVTTLDLLGADFWINGWLASQAAVSEPGTVSFRMMNGMPLAFAGGALALSRFERHRFTATALGGIAAVMAVLALLTYVTGIHMLYSSVMPPALPTAVGVFCVAVAIVLRIGAMPKLHKSRALRELQVMLGCAIVAPLLLFGAYTGARLADAQLRHVRNDLTSEARTLSAEVDREVVGEIERLQALAASPSLRQGDFVAFQRQAEASLALRQSGNIMLIARDMQQLVNTSVPFGTSLKKAAVPEAAQRALVTGEPQITSLFMGPVVKQLLFGIIVPVPIDGENRYALVRSPSQHALERLVAAHALPSGWHAMISDSSHRIIARSGQQDGVVGQVVPTSQQPPSEPAGIFEFIDAAGQPSLQAFALSELTGWKTVVWAQSALLEAPIRAMWRTLGVMGLLAVALVLVLALWLGRIISGSVGHAVRAAVALGEGGALPLSATPVAEVNTLMAELRETAARREAAERLLRDSEATFRAMFDVSSVGKIEVEPGSGRFLRANAAMCNFVGYSEAELLARSVYDITYADDLDADRELCRRLDAGESAFDVEKRYVRKDGNAVWARTTVNVIRDERGRPARHMAVIQDLNARKQAEEGLKASKDRLQLALNAAQLGSWQYDPRHRMF